MNADYRIITDDSDYGANGEVEKQAVFEYMQEQMGLQVFSSQRYIDEGKARRIKKLIEKVCEICWHVTTMKKQWKMYKK